MQAKKETPWRLVPRGRCRESNLPSIDGSLIVARSASRKHATSMESRLWQSTGHGEEFCHRPQLMLQMALQVVLVEATDRLQ